MTMTRAKSKRRLRKSHLCERYGGVTPRTIDRRVEAKKIPPPKYYGGRFPLWDEEELDENDRASS